jgi:NAD(P)-dependent dehydrogenase (short-subunit alcohol dehydrogenase family)
MPFDHARQLEGKVAVITGGGGGIGAEAARLFARHGALLAVTDLRLDAAARVVEELAKAGATAEAFAMDVSDEPSVESTMARIVERFGRIDVLVNSAGISVRKPALEMPLVDWEKTFAVNVRGTFLASRAAARTMQKTGGAVVNLASVLAFSGGLYPNPAYQASKGAILNFTRALAVEWAPLGIRVNAVAPTWTRTPIIRQLEERGMIASIEAAMPMRRLAETHEVAEAILFLAGPASAMTTGHTLPVDGGFLAV